MRAPLVPALFLGLLLGAAFPGRAGAQAPPALLQGHVTADGAAVAGATVSLRAGVEIAGTLTDEAGRYRLPALPPGTYQLRVAATGFRTAGLSGLDIAPGDLLRVDVTLTAGAPVESDERMAEPVHLTGDLRLRLRADLLDHLPIAREQAVSSVTESLPGVGNGSAFGAAAETSMIFRIDGLDVSDPYDGRALASFVLPAVQHVTLTGPGRGVADGGGTGAVLDTLGRPFSAASSALVDVLGTSDALRSEDVPDELLSRNPLLGTPDLITQGTDLSIVLGGALRARTTASAAVGYGRSSLDPTGPRTTGRRVTRRAQGRLLAAGDSHVVTASLLVDAPEETGVLPLEYAQSVGDDLTDTRDRRTIGGRLGWQRQMAGWRISAEYGLLHGRRRLTPASAVPGRIDPVNGTATGSLGLTEEHDRTRHTVRTFLGRDLSGLGMHRVEAGADIELASAAERQGFVGNELFFDPAGRPAFVTEWAGLDREARARRFGLVVQDTWEAARRITIQAGIRGDLLRGSGPGGGSLYTATSWQPRASLAVDVTGTGRLIVRGSGGLYADRLLIAQFDRALPGEAPLVTYEVLANGSRREIERITTPVLGVEDGLRHPAMREFTGGAELRVFPSLTVGATAVVREFTHFVDAVFPDARWLAITRPGLPSRTVTLYRWFNRSASEGSGRIANVDGFEYRAVNGSTLAAAVAERRYTGIVAHGRAELWRRQALVHATFVYARAEGTVDDTFASGLNRSLRFASPSAALANAAGTPTRTPEQELTVFATSRVPWLPLRASALYLAQFAPRYGAARVFATETLDFPYGADGRETRLEALGIRTLPVVHALDVRIEHTLRFGPRQRVTIYTDVTNALNRHAVVEVQSRYPIVAAGGGTILPFEAPLALQAPRQIFIGGRWGF